MDKLTQKILFELMTASGHVDYGDIDPDELVPDKISVDLDRVTLLEIKKALYYASHRAPVVMRQAQENARYLINIIDRQNQLALGEMAHSQ